MEADLQRYYGTDLLDVYRPGAALSLRKLAVLVMYLPPESATATAVRNASADAPGREAGPKPDPAEGPWSVTQMLAADLIDEVRMLRHEYRSVNSDQPGPPPEPVPRPGTGKAKRRALTVAERARLDPRMRAAHDV